MKEYWPSVPRDEEPEEEEKEEEKEEGQRT